MVTKQTSLKMHLEKHPDYSSWIAAAKDDNKVARCTKYNTTFNLSNIREKTLKSHMKGKKHLRRIAPDKFLKQKREGKHCKY